IFAGDRAWILGCRYHRCCQAGAPATSPQAGAGGSEEQKTRIYQILSGPLMRPRPIASLTNGGITGWLRIPPWGATAASDYYLGKRGRSIAHSPTELGVLKAA